MTLTLCYKVLPCSANRSFKERLSGVAIIKGDWVLGRWGVICHVGEKGRREEIARGFCHSKEYR